MKLTQMLVSTATILAATAVAWSQEPESTAKPEPPRALLELRPPIDAKPGQKATADEPGATKATSAGASRQHEAILADVLSQVLKLQEAKANDPHREVLLKLKTVANESCVQCHVGGVSVRNDESLGLTVVPADETLRSQLKLDGKGLVVTAVEHGASGEAGGVKEKDIVVALAGKPVATVEEFQKWLKANGVGTAAPRREPLRLKIVRAGEAREIRVPPPSPPSLRVGNLKITSLRHLPAAPSYWIGVAIGEVDDTLRAHLKLDAGSGLVLTDVIKDSPAARVGLQKNDVLLAVDGQPTKAPDALVKAVQAARDEATLKLSVRRSGEKLDVSVRPEKRKETETVTAAMPHQAVVEYKVNPSPQEWVTQLMPFLDANGGQMTWATPGQPGQLFLWNQANTLNNPPGNPTGWTNAALADAERQALEAAVRRAIEAANGKLSTNNDRLASEVLSRTAELKLAVESMKKSAPPAESLAKIDAQLRALEAQVGEMKRSMDELKSAIKKEQR